MSDHADTIRSAVELLFDAETSVAEAQDAMRDANAAVDALLAERQQAIDEREAAYRNAEWHEAERQKLAAKLRQAIDALREIADHVPGRFVVQSPDYVQLRARARAALLSLGEQP